MRKMIFIGIVSVLAVAGIWWWFALPDHLFNVDRSTVVLSEEGQLLGARIASDGQWRFPDSDSLPEKYRTSLICFEDEGFYNHFGVSPKAIVRAALQNMEAGKVESGGSTITMQLMRMARGNRNRSVYQKAIETIWATRAECRFTKDEILRIYASNAPFGGNVVGLETASWRYFNKPTHQLTWAESATLAVLPNAPGLMFPGRKPVALLEKRNRLLNKLHQKELISSSELELALLEPVPEAPLPLPDLAHHLVDYYHLHKGDRILESTIDMSTQREATTILETHIERLRHNRVENGALLIIDNYTQEVKAYVGNGLVNKTGADRENNMILTPRSSGSILKPFLYGLAYESGEITPAQLIPDIPTEYGGFAPKNFHETYDGAVAAEEAMARSLNIPAVRLLKDYGVPPFLHELNKMGFETLDRSPSHYGLSLILGGGEVSLWDLAQAYSGLAQKLIHPSSSEAISLIHFEKRKTVDKVKYQMPLSEGTVWNLLNGLVKVKRPGVESTWKLFDGQPIAWKTGTSFGFRDAWAVGVSRSYTVAVWVGNANGEGRPGLTGLDAAAPILFDVFNGLPSSHWFSEPYGDLKEYKLCSASGMVATDNCELANSRKLPKSASPASCNRCHVFFTDANGARVNPECHLVSDMVPTKRFVLPTIQAWYYQKSHSDYKGVPALAEYCSEEANREMISLIYPKANSSTIIPREIDGIRESLILKAVHTRDDAKLYWHLNEAYIGSTESFHHMEISPEKGDYQLNISDQYGNSFKTKIRVN